MDLTDTFRIFHPKGAKYTFFSSAHGTFCRTDYIMGYKSAFMRYKKKKKKKTELRRCIFFRSQHHETQNPPQEKSGATTKLGD